MGVAEGGGGRVQRLAGDGAPLVASLVGRERGGAGDAVVSVRSLEPAAPLAAAARARARGARSAPAAARPAGGRGWSPARPASATRPSGRCSSGTASRGRRGRQREPARRYEWPCPGDLLHMDVSELRPLPAARPRVTGDRRSQDRRAARRRSTSSHAIVDDHSRLAYVELHADEQAPPPSPASSSERSPSSPPRDHGAKRLMTDNAWAYTRNRSLRELLARHGRSAT